MLFSIQHSLWRRPLGRPTRPRSSIYKEMMATSIRHNTPSTKTVLLPKSLFSIMSQTLRVPPTTLSPCLLAEEQLGLLVRCLLRSKSSESVCVHLVNFCELTLLSRYLLSETVSTKDNITWAGQVRLHFLYRYKTCLANVARLFV